jgi:hypothetical protein
MPLKLNSSAGGSVTLDATSTASDFTLTVPAVSGTAVVTGSSATVTPTMLSQPMTLMTAQTASGSSVNFTGIPSWVKRITFEMRQVSFAAAGVARVQLGTSSGLTTTGYSSGTVAITAVPGVTVTAITNGIAGFTATDGGSSIVGTVVITLLDTNTWVSNGMVFRANDNILMTSNGHIALSGTLDRISLVATTSTFDAGTVNVLYEG